MTCFFFLDVPFNLALNMLCGVSNSFFIDRLTSSETSSMCVEEFVIYMSRFKKECVLHVQATSLA